MNERSYYKPRRWPKAYSRSIATGHQSSSDQFWCTLGRVQIDHIISQVLASTYDTYVITPVHYDVVTVACRENTSDTLGSCQHALYTPDTPKYMLRTSCAHLYMDQSKRSALFHGIVCETAPPKAKHPQDYTTSSTYSSIVR